jgi:hypothetical protein
MTSGGWDRGSEGLGAVSETGSACVYPKGEHMMAEGREEREGREGGRRCFSEWKFINVFLSAVVISTAISVSNGGAFRGSCQTLGVGVGGSHTAGILSVVRKHELMPRFPQVTEIARTLWRQA